MSRWAFVMLREMLQPKCLPMRRRVTYAVSNRGVGRDQSDRDDPTSSADAASHPRVARRAPAERANPDGAAAAAAGAAARRWLRRRLGAARQPDLVAERPGSLCWRSPPGPHSPGWDTA